MEVTETNGHHNKRVSSDYSGSCGGSSTTSSSSSINEVFLSTSSARELRAKSARDLVQSQERLIDMLQSMRSDISKMEREASRIKEDIVRSNQYVDMVVKMKKPHHLSFSSEGYNLPHSIPKVTYARHRSFDRELNTKYLLQLSTFRPNFLDGSFSRRSSVLSQNSSVYNGDCINRMLNSAPRSRRPSHSSRRSNSSASSGFSGTESDIEPYMQAQNEFNGSTDSFNSPEEAAGSSTESSQSTNVGRPQCSRPPQIENRRSSYVYTVRMATPPHTQSDEVEI